MYAKLSSQISAFYSHLMVEEDETKVSINALMHLSPHMGEKSRHEAHIKNKIQSFGNYHIQQIPEKQTLIRLLALKKIEKQTKVTDERPKESEEYVNDTLETPKTSCR